MAQSLYFRACNTKPRRLVLECLLSGIKRLQHTTNASSTKVGGQTNRSLTCVFRHTPSTTKSEQHTKYAYLVPTIHNQKRGMYTWYLIRLSRKSHRRSASPKSKFTTQHTKTIPTKQRGRHKREVGWGGGVTKTPAAWQRFSARIQPPLVASSSCITSGGYSLGVK